MTSETQSGTILVVDDNVDNRAFAQRFLEAAGYAMVAAADGEEGLRFYQENQSTIVLLLTDVMMPNINGLELADRVLKIDSQLPVLFMSGDAWSAYRGLESVPKPFQEAELVERVSRTLKANRHSERSASALSPR